VTGNEAGRGEAGTCVHSGPGQEPAEERGLVLRPLEPGPDQRDQLGEVALWPGWPGFS
jgi:hypothetical protein